VKFTILAVVDSYLLVEKVGVSVVHDSLPRFSSGQLTQAQIEDGLDISGEM
jgi:hypothetical protein